MKLAITICRALKHLRKLRGKTQEEVYLETGISVGNYEIKNRNPSIENINSLCDYYNYQTANLIELSNASVATGIPVEKLIEDMEI